MKHNFRHLKLETKNTTLVVVIDTGHKANAICFDTLRELKTLALSLQEDVNHSAIILTGTGPIFCGGINLDEPGVLDPMRYSLQERRQQASLGAVVCKAWEDIPAVTIAHRRN